MINLLKLILGVMASLFRSRAALEAGNLVLRQQEQAVWVLFPAIASIKGYLDLAEHTDASGVS
jgi:hypothetical protein